MKIKKAFILFILLVGIVSNVEAKNRLAWTSSGRGWVTIGEDTYYFHKTDGKMYRKGEPCWNEFRWRGNKLYYFCDDGKMLRYSSKYIKLNKDNSVHYLYIAGTNHNERYNAKTGYYQVRKKNGHWASRGDRSNIWWMCDWQP